MEPGIEGTMFNQWYNKEIKIVNDLLQENSFILLHQIETTYGVPSNLQFHNVQISRLKQYATFMHYVRIFVLKNGKTNQFIFARRTWQLI